MGPWKTCRSYDAAIDVETKDADGHPVSDLAKFIQTRDLEALTFKADKWPTWFWLRPMTMGDKRDYVDRGDSDAERYLRAFEVTIERIEGLGKREMIVPKRSARKGEIGKIDDGELDALLEAGLGSACFVDVGSAAYWHATLPLDCSGGYQVPPSSLRALAARAYLSRSAESSSPSSPSRKKPEGQQEWTPLSPQSSVGVGVLDGAAIATG